MYQINNKESLRAIKEKIQQTYPLITDDHLNSSNENEFHLLTRFRKMLSKTQTEIFSIIEKIK